MAFYLRSTLKHWRSIGSIFLQYLYPDLYPSDWSEITVEVLFERINSEDPPLLVDVRSPKEFNEGNGHIPGALSIPMLELPYRLDELEPHREREIVTMCPGGGLSLVAVEILEEAGFKDAKSLQGGFDLWIERGYTTAAC